MTLKYRVKNLLPFTDGDIVTVDYFPETAEFKLFKDSNTWLTLNQTDLETNFTLNSLESVPSMNLVPKKLYMVTQKELHNFPAPFNSLEVFFIEIEYIINGTVAQVIFTNVLFTPTVEQTGLIKLDTLEGEVHDKSLEIAEVNFESIKYE